MNRHSEESSTLTRPAGGPAVREAGPICGEAPCASRPSPIRPRLQKPANVPEENSHKTDRKNST